MRLEVFFDYACPYCLRGHNDLVALLPEYPHISVVWLPCEAHPRPERYGPHSDSLARGMYVAQRHGVNLMEYHNRAYRATLIDRLDINNLNVVAHLVDGLMAPGAFRKDLQDGAFLDKLHENNRLVWETFCFAAVPSYCMDGKTLQSIEGIGVSRQQLADFLAHG